MTRAHRNSPWLLRHSALAIILAGLILATTRAEPSDSSGPKNAPSGTSIQVSGPVWSIALDGDRLHVMHVAWVAAGWFAFQSAMLSTYDLSSPVPQIPTATLPFFDPSQPVAGLSVQHGIAYLAFGASQYGESTAQLRVVDLSDPATLHVMASLGLPANPTCLAVTGGYAYIGDEGTLRIIDASDPTSPTLLGSIAIPGKIASVALRGSFACVGTLDSHLTVVDVSNPLNPNVVATLLIPGTPFDIEIRGAHAYVASGESGLQVIDLSRPSQPRLVGRVDTVGNAVRVAVGGARAYAVDLGVLAPNGTAGLRVIDISNPTRPTVVNSVQSLLQEVSVSDSRIAVEGTISYQDCIAGFGSCETGTMNVAPRSVYERPYAPSASQVASAISRSSASAAAAPTAFRLTGNDPNPFNPQTTIHFDVPRTSRVLVRVYDARGRLVKTLQDSVLQPGQHTISWQGQGERGEALHSGVFFVRMDADGFRQTRKITLLK